MEYTLPVNEMLTEKITKLSSTLIPPGFSGDVRSVRMLQDNLAKLIDRLGEQSSSAQNLNRVITTAEKLRNSKDHSLYVLKDARAQRGNGELIGMLKVGWKHLFLFDDQDKVREVEPLCVLDFFVVPEHQRNGNGKVLFDHMLKDMNASPKELAIDGPSPKMERFLSKNYGMDRLIRQTTNFAISPEFFAAISETKSERSTPVVSARVGRFAAPKPQSVIGNVIHGDCGHQEASNNGRTSPVPTPEEDDGAAANTQLSEKDFKKDVKEPTNLTDSVAVKQANVPNSPERPKSLDVESVAETPAQDVSPAGSTNSRRGSQLTERGYFDVKFYHNKLW